MKSPTLRASKNRLNIKTNSAVALASFPPTSLSAFPTDSLKTYMYTVKLKESKHTTNILYYLGSKIHMYILANEVNLWTCSNLSFGTSASPVPLPLSLSYKACICPHEMLLYNHCTEIRHQETCKEKIELEGTYQSYPCRL